MCTNPIPKFPRMPAYSSASPELSATTCFTTWPVQHPWTRQQWTFLPEQGTIATRLSRSSSPSLTELPCFLASSRYTTQPVQQLSWRVQRPPLDGHYDVLPSPRWHTVARKYFDSSPFPTHATMTARVFDLDVLQDHFHSIPEFYRKKDKLLHHVVSISHQQCLHTSARRVNLCTVNHPRARREECLTPLGE